MGWSQTFIEALTPHFDPDQRLIRLGQPADKETRERPAGDDST